MANYYKPAATAHTIVGNGPVGKASGTLSGTTFNLYTVAGGAVLISHFWLNVTTSITTDSGTLALELVPTTGDTLTLVTATDLGTTDTVAGDQVGLTRGTTAASSFLRGGTTRLDAVVWTGIVKLLGAASVNGAVTANCFWVPLDVGATLVSA